MARPRVFVQDNGDGTYSVVMEVNGAFEELERSTDLDRMQRLAPVYAETRGASGGTAPPWTYTTPPPTAPARGPAGQSYVGGTANLDAEYQANQMAYLLRKLDELEKPGLDLQRRAQILNEIQAAANLSGYYNPYQERRLLAGYNTSMAAAGTTGATAAGTEKRYNTVNGPKTMAQMRAELVALGGEHWNSVSDDAVIAEYATVTKGPVTAEATSGTTTSASDFMDRLVKWQTDFKTRTGRDPSRDEWVQWASFAAGLSPEQAAQLRTYADQMWAITGGNMSASDWDGLIARVSQSPTLTREQMQEQNRQFWANYLQGASGAGMFMQAPAAKAAAEKALQESGTPITGTVADILANPNYANWQGYWGAQAQQTPRSGNIMDLFGARPAFGQVRQLPQAQPTTTQGQGGYYPRQTAQALQQGAPRPPWLSPEPIQGPTRYPGGRPQAPAPPANWYTATTRSGAPPGPELPVGPFVFNEPYGGERATGTINQPFIQPTTISLWEYNRMTPDEKAGVESVWKAYNQPVASMWDIMRKAFPQGSRNTLVNWR